MDSRMADILLLTLAAVSACFLGVKALLMPIRGYKAVPLRPMYEFDPDPGTTADNPTREARFVGVMGSGTAIGEGPALESAGICRKLAYRDI